MSQTSSYCPNEIFATSRQLVIYSGYMAIFFYPGRVPSDRVQRLVPRRVGATECTRLIKFTEFSIHIATQRNV